MKRLLIVTVSLSLSMGGAQGISLAQQTTAPVIEGNVNGSCVSSANGNDRTITCGDLNPASGMTVIGPPAVETVPAAIEEVPAPAPDVEPAVGDEPALVEDSGEETLVDAVETETTVDAAAADSAIASEADLDADNYPDALEVEAGLDPNNVDTDADGVADGDEGNIYGTDPLTWDSDGDGVSDGDELYERRTDPLVGDDFTIESGAAASEEGAVEAATDEELADDAVEAPGDAVDLAQKSSENVSATNGDAAALGSGNASSAPGTVTRGGVTTPSLLGPDGTYRVTEVSPPTVNAPTDTVVEIAPPSAREPVAAAPVDEVAPDSDGDWVADSDERAVYGTDPTIWDTDGDGLGDGDELFVAGTDPFVWDTNGDGVSDGGSEAAAATEAVVEAEPLVADEPLVAAEPLVAEEGAPVVAEDGATETAVVDSDLDRLADADEAATGTDPNSPDSDGDGYYDGDEVNLGTDPHDPALFPAT